MKIFRGLDFQIKNPCVMALGTFDGIHLAHQKLLRFARRLARSRGLKFAVFSFQNLPRNLFVAKPLQLIMTVSEKEECFRRLKVDYLIHLEFTRDFSRLTAREFVEFLHERCRINYLCAGFNFKFGHLNRGDVAFLSRACELLGIETRVIPPVERNGEIVSSSLIRDKIAEGKIEEAVCFLNHPLLISGRVICGRGAGRTFGFPTANLIPEEEIVPKYGVYFCYAILPGKMILPGVINIGLVPSFFTGGLPRFELHILDFNGNLYRKKITVALLHYRRPESKLTQAELKKCIALDIKAARSYFATRGKDDKILHSVSGP
ncbi:MAG: riboflavin biosynthesis protein RibF [Candidatus Wallbacteria bacterium]|nr:riboflavin biosynthesis protein RibF [Candidatus Wallbacteria bacterium]